MVINITKLTKETLPTLLVILFSLTSLGRLYFDSGLLLQISLYGMVTIGVISYIYIIFVKLTMKNILIPIVVLSVLLFTAIYNNNLDQQFFMPFLYIGIGLLLINFKLNYRLVLFSFILHTIFFIVHFPIGAGSPILTYTSRNYHSVIIIYNAMLVYISMHQNNLKVKLFPVISTIVICLWSIGRSGIISSTIFLFVVLLEKMKTGKTSVRHIQITFSFALLVALVYLWFFVFDNSLIYNYTSRITEFGFQDDARSSLIREYLHLMTYSMQNFIFGVNLDFNNLFNMYSLNLHNSYLRLHSIFGLPGVLIFLALLLNSVIKYWKHNKYYIFLLSVILIRISTDQAAFFGTFDPLIIYFTLNSFVTSRRKKLNINY